MNSTPYCLEFLRVSKGTFLLRRFLQGCSSVLTPQQKDDPASASGLWLPQGMNLQGVGERPPPLGLQQGPFESSCCLASGESAPWEQGYLIHTALWHMEERAYRIDELDSWSTHSKSSLGRCLHHCSTLPLRVSLSKQACTQMSQRIGTYALTHVDSPTSSFSSSSTVWIPGTELRSAHLAADTFTPWQWGRIFICIIPPPPILPFHVIKQWMKRLSCSLLTKY